MAELPLLRRFPALAQLARSPFGSFPTPVERVAVRDGHLWVKRDDLASTRIGGNKIRGLEWLLGGVRSRDHVVTVGPRGSTHALATARFTSSLGARATIVRWNQQMNTAARQVDALLRSEARVIDARFVLVAYAIAAGLRTLPKTRWIPAGGASRIGLLGYVNGALELVEQAERGECELPERVVVAFGTGATAAGLALGFRIAHVDTRIIAVRVVPRALGRRGRVLRLAASTAALIERMSGERLTRVLPRDVLVEHRFYGGSYGRPLQTGADERSLEAGGIRLDDTYTRKAYAAALAHLDGHTLLWLTFDGRLLTG